MKKILSFIDDNILRFIVAFAILFIPLYPKLPSISISHVWVYIRLEDFLIFFIVVVWLIQLIRNKVTLPKPEGLALIGYWLAGLVSLLFCFAFIAPHLVNFFTKVAALEFLRRVEYMILFFAAFSSVKKQKDILFYLWTLSITVALIIIYGFGQKFYAVIWALFPSFFKLYPFCFPAFLTGNEEFAKGTPFCLNDLSRISSTFGGHYDLAAYLVVVIPILVALFIVVKRWYFKIPIALLSIFALEILNFTSSRTSFAAYLLGAVGMLILWKKKLWIIPVVIVSVGVLFLFSTTTLQRFTKTVQQVQVVQVQPGSTQEIQKAIEKVQQNQANSQPQSPPPGTVTVGGENAFASESGQVVTEAELKSLEEQNINISTVSGAFLLRKAYALDVSLTTRFQAEWPRDWNAFLSSPIFGTGYSSLTLASDNDYLRALGETGLAGMLSFYLIFIVLGIYMKKVIKSVKDPITKAFIFGLAGGIIGLLINATLIDVFEASKVAEPLWILLGIAVGSAKLYQKEAVPYKKELTNFVLSQPMIIVYSLILVCAAFGASLNNFFVANDFTWLHWAATATKSDLPKYFINAQNNFYMPLAKVIVYFLYNVFSFQPQGYHLFVLLLHFLTAVGVYFLAKKLTQNKLVGVLTAFLFILHPAHMENIYWFSTIPVELGSMFIVFMMLSYITFRERSSFIAYIITIFLSIFAFVSYEISVVIPFILIAMDWLLLRTKWNKKTVMSYVPFVLLFVLYFAIRPLAHVFSGGGDYSYHLSRFIPNVIGNFFGYTGLFLGGMPFLSFYNFLRIGLRADWIYFTIAAVILLGYIAWMLALYRGKITVLLRKQIFQLFTFCIVFAFIALLPYLPLGNIAPRYDYLASIGFTLALVLALKLVFEKWIKSPRYAIAMFIIVSVILGGVYFISDQHELNEWHTSGLITKNTLLFFRKNYPSFSAKSNLYFVNTPIQLNDTWVFSVGLSDGLWFIYRDGTPQVHEVSSLQEAQNRIAISKNNDHYIFTFDEKGSIKQLK